MLHVMLYSVEDLVKVRSEGFQIFRQGSLHLIDLMDQLFLHQVPILLHCLLRSSGFADIFLFKLFKFAPKPLPDLFLLCSKPKR